MANNITVVVAGGFDPSVAHDYLHASLGGLRAAQIPVLEFADPPSPIARRVQIPFQGTADELALAWLGPRYTDSNFHDLVALDVVMDILTLKQFGVHDFLEDLESSPIRNLRLLGPSVYIHAGIFSAGTLTNAPRGVLFRLRALRTGLISRRTFGLVKNARLAQMAEYHQSSYAGAEALASLREAKAKSRVVSAISEARASASSGPVRRPRRLSRCVRSCAGVHWTSRKPSALRAARPVRDTGGRRG